LTLKPHTPKQLGRHVAYSGPAEFDVQYADILADIPAAERKCAFPTPYTLNPEL